MHQVVEEGGGSKARGNREGRCARTTLNTRVHPVPSMVMAVADQAPDRVACGWDQQWIDNLSDISVG